MQKIHPLDVKSGLSCYTCNKTFSKRDLINNHFNTVKHQLECKKLMEEEKAEQRCQNYTKNLMKINNFKVRPYKEREWQIKEKPVRIPIESTDKLSDPRKARKRKIDILKQKLEATSEKIRKLKEGAIAVNASKSKDLSQVTPIFVNLPENCENTSNSKTEDIIQLDVEHIELTTENQEEIPCTVQSPFKGRSTLDLTDLPIHTETNMEKEPQEEIIKTDSTDAIPSKSTDFQPNQVNLPGKTPEMPNYSPETRSSSVQPKQPLPEDTVEIYISATEEDTIDQDLDNFIKEYLNSNIKETRTVNLDNQWIITDTIGTPDFPELLKEDPNFDLLTFITDNLPF